MSETKEIKFKMHKTKKFFVKNRLVLHFNNIGKSFLSMYLYKNENLDMFETYFFEEHEIVNGLPVNINKISDIIRNFVVKVDSIQLAISTNDAFKTTISLPKISKAKARKLYREEVKYDAGERKDSYLPFFESYAHPLGYIFYTYFIPLNIINTFSKVASLLKTKLTKVDLFSRFIYNNVKTKIKDDFVLHYDNNNLSTFILSYNNSFSGFSAFESDPNKMKLNYVSSISKHCFELEKKDIDCIYSNNMDFLSDMCEVKKVDILLDIYNFKGVDL